MKLEFGNPEHIALRDEGIAETAWLQIKDKIKCPICGAKAHHYFDYDLKEKWLGINFLCKPGCMNSVEYACEHGCDEPDVYFDFNGKKV